MKKIIAFLVRFVPRPVLQRMSGLGLAVLGIFYRGKNVECPICRSQYREFLPYGRLNPRPNALCARCLSLERHRLIWLYLNNQTNFFKTTLSVLHIAPEGCFMDRFEKQHGIGYITADLESPLAKVKMDIHHMPFPENQFDAVLCNHVMEHVQDDIQAMREIRRVLKPGGWAILQVPFFSPVPDVTVEDTGITDKREREQAFGQDDHVRKYGKDYLARIERSGLKALGEKYASTFSDMEAKKFGIVREEIIYRAEK